MIEERFSLWTYHDDPSWNLGFPDMMIVSGLPLTSAHMAQQRLRIVSPEKEWEIRNERDEIVTTREVVTDPATNAEIHIVDVCPRPARRSAPRPARRKLGQGAR